MAEGEATNFFDNPGENWQQQIAGDNEQHLEAIKDFENPQALFANFFETQGQVTDLQAQLEKAGGSKDPWFQSHDEDWREQIAGEDESRLNQLKRFADPGAMMNSFWEAQTALSKRNDLLAAVLPDDPSDEQLAAYREKHGIPESADKYEFNLSEGLVLSDDDKKDFQPLFEYLHENHVSGEMASGIVDKYLNIQNQVVAAEEAQDVTDAQNCVSALQSVWKGEYEVNHNMVKNMFASTLPEEALDTFMNARLSNGTALFNDPNIIAAFATMARQLNPAAALVPAGKDALTAMSTRKAELEGKIGSDEWYKRNDWQKEYQDILEAEAALEARQQA